MALAGSTASAEERRPASYPEGPLWLNGAAHWAEMGADRVMRGVPEVAPVFERRGCGPTAVAPYRSDELVVLCHLEGTVVHLAADGTVRVVAQDRLGRPLRDPNDATSDGRGGVWFTDPGRFSVRAPAEGRLMHLDAEGKLAAVVEGLRYGNGVHFDRDRKRLLLSEHLARRVLSFPVREDGALGPPEILFDLDELTLPDVTPYAEAGPDGLELDPSGRLWVAEYGAGRLLVWQSGALLGWVPVKMRFVTNIAIARDGRVVVTGAHRNDVPDLPGEVVMTDLETLLGRLIRPKADAEKL